MKVPNVGFCNGLQDSIPWCSGFDNSSAKLRTDSSPKKNKNLVQCSTVLECEPHTLLKMGRYYNTTMRHYWGMLVK